jgi:hypothetical protein
MVNHVRFQNSHIISQEAIHLLLVDALNNDTMPFIPMKLLPPPSPPMSVKHYAMPVVHPITGETISSYKKLMKDQVTAETWQMAFGKDFRGMCQGDNKSGTIGTNAMFMMTPTEVTNIPPDRFTMYANIVVDFRPQKEDPHRMQITAEGNLINHPGELTTRMALEQCPQYTKSKIIVPRPHKILPVSPA